jgi:hypothetical protein
VPHALERGLGVAAQTIRLTPGLAPGGANLVLEVAPTATNGPRPAALEAIKPAPQPSPIRGRLSSLHERVASLQRGADLDQQGTLSLPGGSLDAG